MADYDQSWKVKTRLYDGISEMLDSLTALGIDMAILSNKSHGFTVNCVRDLLSKWRFKAVFGLREDVPRKPDPAGALEISRLLGVDPDRMLYLGDTAIDMQTAVSAGMFPVGALWGFRTREELLENGAKALIDHPRELLQSDLIYRETIASLWKNTKNFISFGFSFGASGVNEIIDIQISAQRTGSKDGIVVHPHEILRNQACLPHPERHFSGLDEPAVGVGSSGNQPHQIFGGDNRQQKRFGIPVEGRKKHIAPGFDQGFTGVDDGTGIGDVLQHFQAGNDIKDGCVGLRQVFDGRLQIAHLKRAFPQVMPGGIQGRFSPVDSGHRRSQRRHGLR